MKRFTSIFLFIMCCLLFAGCESGNELKTVTFYNITSAGSDDYTFRVVFAEDKRVDNKYYDLQIKADGNKTISIGQEMQEKKEVQLSNKWASLTTLMLNEPKTETFTKGSDAQTLVYIFNVKEKTKITIRAVVGGVEENDGKTGYIITSPEDCSEEFVIETK